MVDGTTILVKVTTIVPQTKETEDALSNSWGVVCLAGISYSFRFGHGEAYMVAWSLVPVGSSAMGPTLVAVTTMVRTRTPAGVTVSMMGMCRTGTTATATSPSF